MVAELQHRGRAGLDAELVFDRHAVHVVALAQAAVGVDQVLGHDEQRDALDALGRVGRAGQHQMDDVFRHVVLAVGDEDLGAEDLVGAVALRLGAGAHRGQVRARLRLGQVHGAGPLAADQPGQEGGLLFVRAGGQQRFDGAVGQQRAQRERQVGAVQHFDAGGGDQLGQALAAEVLRMQHALPAAFAELAEGIPETGGRGDHAILPAARIQVAGAVQRRQHLFIELGGFVEHGPGRFRRGFLEAGQAADRV
ncbi:hypothetical protein D9M69_134920 [compost metagenome]